MLKFIRGGKSQQVSVERQKLQKELFAFRKTVQHGFPHKPTAIAFDPIQRLMAIGTQTGALKVFGQPGVEFYGQHTTGNSGTPTSSSSSTSSDVAVQLLEWVPGSGRVLSLTTANQLTLWEPAGYALVPIKSLPFDGKLKKISSLCCARANDLVWIGTEGGNVYPFDLHTFTVKEPVIYHDVVLEQVPATYKLNPGAIEAVRQVPGEDNQLLIAYNRGLTVLWDLEQSAVVRSFIAPGHGQSVGLHVSPRGDCFTWYHADGSYATWQLDSEELPENEAYVPYGPDPCKSINRLVRTCRGNDELVVFSGGMPRSAYGDHQCVSVHCADGTKVALDFTSKVIDFFVTVDKHADGDEQEEEEEDSVADQGRVLVVLLEEELVAFDLSQAKLPAIRTPYLHSIHASAVTCNHIVSQVTRDIYEKILIAGQQQQVNDSLQPWPVTGGILPPSASSSDSQEYDILLSGHEDGSVRFWDCSGVVLVPLLHLKTAPLFINPEEDAGEHEEAAENDDGDPPFRKAGQFDPYSDDPRLAVKKVGLCPTKGIVTIAGTAGHVVVASLDGATGESALKVTTMNLVSDRDGFVWKGHDQLKVRQSLLEDTYHTDEGVQVLAVLQILPPAQVTCIAMETNWNLVAAGTAHGLALFDYMSQSPVLNRCTLNPNDLSGAGETLSRKKSFKKTLRESFRRLRRGRSQRNNPAQQATNTPILETRPVERQIEARSLDDGMGSMVRCLAFAQTYLTSMQTTIATLWSATNSSCVSVFVLHVPPKSEVEVPLEQRRQITGQLAKEIQLKHRAPVVGIEVVDHNGIPLNFPGAGMAPHRVLIASEEQFKVFSLPQLKPVNKYKLTAHEGARVRRMQFAQFSCPELDRSHNTSGTGSEEAAPSAVHTEVGLLCLTNLGDVLVLSVPELKRQLNAAAVRREDINGISSLCFTSHGEALYMMSSSEVQRVTLSTMKIVTPEGIVDVSSAAKEQAVTQNGHKSDGEEDADNTLTEEELPKPEEQEEVKEEVRVTRNGSLGSIPNLANETITSSIGDITVDSVRDHLNSTTTTIHSTQDEIVGRVSVLTTRTSDKVTSATIKDLDKLNLMHLKDLTSVGESQEGTATSVVVKSVITSVSSSTNGEQSETVKRTTLRKESQF